jgi:hypothetical protein
VVKLGGPIGFESGVMWDAVLHVCPEAPDQKSDALKRVPYKTESRSSKIETNQSQIIKET